MAPGASPGVHVAREEDLPRRGGRIVRRPLAGLSSLQCDETRRLARQATFCRRRAPGNPEIGRCVRAKALTGLDESPYVRGAFQPPAPAASIMSDPYKILGVSKAASEAEIKKAFRSLAKKYHPDTKGGDAAAQ